MKPAIKGGELAYAELYHGQPLLAGEIVDNGVVTHRITAVSDDAILTSGDNARYSDGWTPKSKIRFIIRYIVRP